jgi:Zn-dependent protease with chaperone function
VGRRTGERETFYEAQRRHRRASWRFTALSAVAVALLGLPLSVVVSPLLSGLVIIGSDVANQVVDTPDAVAGLEDVADRWSAAVDARERGEPADFPVRQAATVAGLLLVPGVVMMLLAWLAVRRIFMRSATGAVVLAAGARPPNPADVEERQLVNLVEEMALAAGVRPPRVMVVDADILNAAVVGRSVDDVTIVVPRRLLAELGRDPTSAVIADLLATVVNGDLRAALVIASVYQTFDLVGAVIAAPLSRRTRRALWRLFRLPLRRRSTAATSDGREEPWIAEELADLAALGGLEDDPDEGSGAAGCLTFPFLAVSIAHNMTQLLLGSTLVTPVLAALWRRRRLLADAGAIQLTRNPDALIHAFTHMERREAGVPPGPWTHLFLVGPELRAGLARRRMDQRLAELRADAPRPGESSWASARRKVRESSAAQSEYQRALDEAEGGVTDPNPMRSGLRGFIPRMDKRLARLEALGGRLAERPSAPVTARRPRPEGVGGWIKRGLFWVATATAAVVLLSLVAVCVAGLLFCLFALVYLALLFQLLLVAVPVLLVNAGLR